METKSNGTGYREADGDGIVIHFRFRAGIACRTKGINRQAATNPNTVNCKKCLAVIAKIRGQRTT